MYIFAYGIGRALIVPSILHFLKFAIVLETFILCFFYMRVSFVHLIKESYMLYAHFRVIVTEWIWKCIHVLPFGFFKHGFFKLLQVILFFKRISR